MAKMLNQHRALHTGEIRFFSGIHPVKELPPESWASCHTIYEKCAQTKSAYMRGYEVQSNGILGSKGDKVRLPSTLCYKVQNLRGNR